MFSFILDQGEARIEKATFRPTRLHVCFLKRGRRRANRQSTLVDIDRDRDSDSDSDRSQRVAWFLVLSERALP